LNIFNSKYFWRSYIGYVVLGANAVVLLCLILLIDNAGAEREATTTQLRAHAQLLALAASDPLERGDTLKVQGLVENLGKATSALRVTVIDRSGVVLADSHESPAAMENLLHRPEMQLALSRGIGLADRYSEPLAQGFYYAAVPIVAAEKVLGVARVGRALSDINQAQADRQLSTHGLFRRSRRLAPHRHLPRLAQG